MSDQKKEAKNLLYILTTNLRASKDALCKISRDNPMSVIKYNAYQIKGIRLTPSFFQISDSSGKSFVGYVSDFFVWLPAFRWNSKTQYKMKWEFEEFSLYGAQLLSGVRRSKVRFFTCPPETNKDVSENVKTAIRNFLKTVAENPREQQPLTSMPNCKNGFKLIDAGFVMEDVFWFTPETDRDVYNNEVYLAFNLSETQRQIEAAENWKRPPVYAKGLSTFFDTSQATIANLRKVEPSILTSEPDWEILTDLRRAGTDQQREFVRKALTTPDLALLEGPPGSGKTTVILELILQLVKQGKRVLLSSATHVAIDNVLERLVDLQELDLKTKKPKNQASTEILAVRIAGNPKNITSKAVESLHETAMTTKLRNDLKSHFQNLRYKTEGQQMMIGNDEKSDEEKFSHFLLNQANVVAGTLVGLLQHKGLKDRQPDFEPFDYLIVDEASKVTLSGFLVPAQWTSRWILVGDTHQLAPYSEKAVLETILMTKQDLLPELADEVVSNMSNAYDYRQHPVQSIKHKQELSKVFTKITRENIFGKYVQDEDKVEAIKEVGQLFLPSVFELFQRGLPDWLQTNSQQFTLHSGVEKITNVRNNGTEFYFQSSDDELEKIWKNRFQPLSFQHRMIDELAIIPRKYFYDGKNMHSDPKAPPRDIRFQKLLGELDCDASVWIKGTGKWDNQKGNREEAENVIKVLKLIDQSLATTSQDKKLRVLVITFYKAQFKLLNQKIGNGTQFQNIQVDRKTVDSVQGQEAEIVLLCFSKWSKQAFYQVPNRLNVAITRAKQRMFLFGSPEDINTEHPALEALCNDIKSIQL